MIRNYYEGNVNDDPNFISWTGYSNYSWQEVQTQLFPMPKVDIDFWRSAKETTAEVKFLLPLGFCIEITKFQSKIYMGTKTPFQMYFTDPGRQNFYRLEKMLWLMNQ